jgi:ribosomal protein L11 methyltransferase
MSPPLRIPPCWWVLPPEAPRPEAGHVLRFAPGAGWGDGAHPTTQLCLQALAWLAPRTAAGWRLLDFGSGSGLLSIAAARLGADQVLGVEIDREGLAHAHANARLNGLDDRVRFAAAAGDEGGFDVVVANILRGVLLEHAGDLAGRLGPHGTLILSGLVATDVPGVSTRYSGLLGGRTPEIFGRGDWRALVWRASRPGC